MPSLLELDARFMQYEVTIADQCHGRKLPDGTTQWGGFEVDTFIKVDTLTDAHGLWFDCPKCYTAWKAGSEHGPHAVLVWFEGSPVPDHIGKNKDGKTVRWKVAGGTGLSDLILTPSIQLQGGGCEWHGFVGSGGVPPGYAQ